MSERLKASAALWGAASVVAGALMLEGGVREVVAFLPMRDWLPVALGALGALASAVLLWSGVSLWLGDPSARKTATVGALAMVAVHPVGFAAGYVGIPGLLLGVVYPLMVLALGRIDGTPARTAGRDRGKAPSGRENGTHLMSASVA